ncbi:DUF2586 domain-containing protein [Pseudoalteromonas sp. S16_S37]|uniref:DUF2586 domain-containing protein n=1 Tax=Pseudoalteromonas sp. S16_S37 TaxID=2720228 RepID=UPI001680FDAC|nr:DUF2586 domain-containing protein [Pseudoalteromonas sp. S16_S37]MBD1582796.1 DUF2586 family protein [Pseudoalteromonas sp. S16_S37]
MAQGKVSVATLQTGSGAIAEVERTVLFIGEAPKNNGSIQPINAQSDFDALFDETDSPLKTQLQAWQRNGDDLVSGYAISHTSDDNVLSLIDKAMEQDVNPEIIVICKPATGKAEVESYQAKNLEIQSKYARYVRTLVAVPGLDGTQTWADLITALQPITDGVVAERVAVVPLLIGDELGGVVGRLCKRSVTIADSPMRTKTGAMSLLTAPVDSAGTPLTNATTSALDALRFSCVQYYTSLDGTYFGDVNMLDANGGDFQQIEIGRVLDMAARQVHVKATYEIKNRQLNNSPTGIAYGKRKLSKPLFDMSKSITIGEDRFPGLIDAPTEDSISLTFLNEKHVHIVLKIKPIDSPNTITVGIMLDS